MSVRLAEACWGAVMTAVLTWSAARRAAGCGVGLRPTGWLWAAALAAAAAGAGAFSGGDQLWAAKLALTWACSAVCALTDAQTGYVFDAVTLPSLLGLLALAAADGRLEVALTGACAGAIALYSLHALSGGRAMGMGDVKLSACMGAGLGAQAALAALGAAFVLGGAYGAYLLATKRARRGDTLRFAPYLAAGTAAGTLWSWLT